MKKLLIIIGIILIICGISSIFKVDINDEQAVLKHIQGTWVGYSHEGGIYTHFKIEIYENTKFKGWIKIADIEDEPSSWDNYDIKGSFILSPVSGYTNTSGKYRNIIFEPDNKNNTLSANLLQQNIIYDNGLYVVGWSRMSKK